MITEPICTSPVLDSTLYAGVTSNSYSPSDFQAFLCNVMKLAGIDNVDPVLYENPNPIDFSSFATNFTSLTGVGDPRISLGDVLKSTLGYFIPIANTQIEVRREGGCQVIENYICDSDGNKRKELTSYCPPNFSMAPITTNDIVTYTMNVIENSINDHADRFVNYVRGYTNSGFGIGLFYYTQYKMFYVKLTRDYTVYLKYYHDAANRVSQDLGVGITLRSDSLFDDSNHYNAMIAQIPNY